MITKQRTSRSTVKGLDKTRILRLLAEADSRWFRKHHGEFNYREHLQFTAEYLAGNYLRTERGRRNDQTELLP